MARKRQVSSDEESSSSSEEEDEEESSSSGEDDESSSSASSSSEDEEVVKKKPARKAPAAAATKKPSAAKPTPIKKPSAAKKPAAKKIKPAAESSESEEEELGGTAAVVDADDPGYGSDLIKNEEDGNYLKSLSEVDREQVLSDRYEKRQMWKEMIKLRGGKPPAAASAKTTQTKKKLVSAADSDDDKKKRPTPAKKKTPAVVATAAPAAAIVTVQEESSSSSSSSSSDEDEEIPKRKGSRHDADVQEEDEDDLPADYHDPVTFGRAQKICVSRKQVLDWMDYPKFRSGLRKCLLKVRTDDGRYALMQISDIELTEDSYVVDKERVIFNFKVSNMPSGQNLVSLARVSNKPLTMHEFEQWKMEKPLSEMKNSHAYRALKELSSKLINVRFTNKEVMQKVEAGNFRRGARTALTSKRFGVNPVEKKNLLEKELQKEQDEKLRLIGELNAAEEDAERDKLIRKMRKVSDQIQQLEKELDETKTKIEQNVKRVLANEAASKLNQANAERNAQALFDDNAGTRAPVTSNFVRRPTRPQVMWDVVGKKAATNEEEEVKVVEPQQQHQEQQNEVFDSTQPDYDADLGVAGGEEEPQETLVKPIQVFLRIQPGSTMAKSTATKRYTLEEYQKLRAGGNRRW